MVSTMLSNWLKATLFSMTVVGIGAWFGFLAMDLPQAFVLGFIAGVASFIPNFGPLFALIPAVIVALAISPQDALLVIVLLYGLSFLQNQILNPLLMAETINLPPALLLIGQIVGGFFFGFLGLLLAVPITAILMILVREIYIKDLLGHQVT